MRLAKRSVAVAAKQLTNGARLVVVVNVPIVALAHLLAADSAAVLLALHHGCEGSRLQSICLLTVLGCELSGAALVSGFLGGRTALPAMRVQAVFVLLTTSKRRCRQLPAAPRALPRVAGE